MSRTINTQPHFVLAHHLPAWEVIEVHHCDATRPCDVHQVKRDFRWHDTDRCGRRICFSLRGISARGYTHDEERADRARVRVLLGNAVKLANGHRADLDEVDVPERIRDVSWDLW